MFRRSLGRWSAAAASLAALTGVLSLGTQARADGWGTIKGQVVWGGESAPERKKIDVNKDQMTCLKDGPLLSETYVVDPKSKGIRWVVFFLTDPATPNKAIPTHPDLENQAKKTVEMDQPHCMFEPHVVAMQQGQTLVVKNSSDIPHNVHFSSIPPGPNLNQIVPPGRSLKVEPKAVSSAISIKCDIHGWMQAYAFVLPHPYFAVTGEDGTFEIKNAPAGKYRLVGWKDGVGWVLGDAKPNKKGKLITISADEVTDLGKITLKQ